MKVQFMMPNTEKSSRLGPMENLILFRPEEGRFCPIYERYSGQDFDTLYGLFVGGSSYVWIDDYNSDSSVAFSHGGSGKSPF